MVAWQVCRLRLSCGYMGGCGAGAGLPTLGDLSTAWSLGERVEKCIAGRRRGGREKGPYEKVSRRSARC